MGPRVRLSWRRWSVQQTESRSGRRGARSWRETADGCLKSRNLHWRPLLFPFLSLHLFCTINQPVLIQPTCYRSYLRARATPGLPSRLSLSSRPEARLSAASAASALSGGGGFPTLPNLTSLSLHRGATARHCLSRFRPSVCLSVCLSGWWWWWW